MVGILGLTTATTGPNVANAGWLVQGSPEVIDPKDAVIDSDLLKSSEVQGSIKDVKAYKETVARISKILRVFRKIPSYHKMNPKCQLYKTIYKFDRRKNYHGLLGSTGNSHSQYLLISDLHELFGN